MSARAISSSSSAAGLGGLVLRAHARRLARRLRTAGSALARTRVVYATRTFGEVEVDLRMPEVGDAAQWRETRLREQDRFAGSFGDDNGDWVDRHSDLAWTERCVRLRLAAARGAAMPAVLATGDGAILGELGVDAVDPRTGTGEFSAWTSRDLPSRVVVSWALETMVAQAFAPPSGLRRLVAPVAVPNPGPATALRAVGFGLEFTARDYRHYAGSFIDHHIFVLQHDTWWRNSEHTTGATGTV